MADEASQELVNALLAYRSPVRGAVETPQPINRNAANAGPLSPMNKLVLDIRGPNAEPQRIDDYINDQGRQIGFGFMGGVKFPARISNPVKAYHGSPQGNITAFKEEWPTFVSESPEYSENYRAGATDRGGTLPEGYYFAHRAINENAANPQRALEDAKLTSLKYSRDADDLDWILNKYGGARRLLQAGEGRGHVYELNMHAPRENMLDWDKPLEQQSETVKKALADAGLQPHLTTGDFEGWTERNQQALRDAGIPVVSYKAGRNQNHMVTDPSILEILRKYGLAGPAALGAMGALTQDQNQQ